MEVLTPDKYIAEREGMINIEVVTKNCDVSKVGRKVL
jgi:hypothetical protein